MCVAVICELLNEIEIRLKKRKPQARTRVTEVTTLFFSGRMP
jgi:hypothetical protein